MNDATYTVRGMHCQSCVANVGERVGRLDGVESVDVDLPSEKVIVRGESLDDAAIRSAIAAAGYQPV